MFDTESAWDEPDPWIEVEGLEHRLDELKAVVAATQLEQSQIVARLDALQVDAGDGCQSMQQWVSERLDLSPQTAKRLVGLSHASERVLNLVRERGYGLDRGYLLHQLDITGVSPQELSVVGDEYSLGRLWRLCDRQRRVDPGQEQFVFENRFLVMQPSLDDSAWRLWGMLTAQDGEIIDQALTRREGELPAFDVTSGARKADALTSICMDSLTTNTSGTSGDGDEAGVLGRGVTVAEVIVDARLAVSTDGEAGASVTGGPRVGANALEEILCAGKIRVTVSDGDRVAWSDLGEAIPPAVRALVWHRDMGSCSIAGCNSRYRLQIHHIRERSRGGGHNPENLILVCWFHHHVAIHGLGFRIDPDSPVHRRRLKHPDPFYHPPDPEGPDPPHSGWITNLHRNEPLARQLSTTSQVT